MNRIDIRGKKDVEKIKKNKKSAKKGKREEREREQNMTKCNNSYNKCDGISFHLKKKALKLYKTNVKICVITNIKLIQKDVNKIHSNLLSKFNSRPTFNFQNI